MYNTLNISQQLSKTILNSIIEDKDINYDNLSLKGYSKKIELLRKEYKKLNFKKNGSIEIPFQIKKNNTKGHVNHKH